MGLVVGKLFVTTQFDEKAKALVSRRAVLQKCMSFRKALRALRNLHVDSLSFIQL